MESNRITITNASDNNNTTTNPNSSSRERTNSSSSRTDYRLVIPRRVRELPQGVPRVGPLHQFQTWVRQNDNGERQRRHYTAFYLERNNINNSRSNPDVITSTEPQFPPGSIPRSITVIEDPNLQNDVTNASTQTISSNSFANVAEATTRTTPPNMGFNEYFHTIASFLSTLPSSSTSNSIPRMTFPEHLSPTQILRSAIIAFPEANFGLNKSEINRHTVSYQYKPKKRKRMKTIVSSTSSSSSSSSAIDLKEQCHICLDMFNTSVLVRRLPCLHVFHIKCIDKWLKRNKKCPVCRISITINYDTLMSSLESGSTIDQCISQQETSSLNNGSSFISIFSEDNSISDARNQLFSVND